MINVAQPAIFSRYGLDATRWCHIYHGEANMSGRRWPVADPQKIRSCPMGQPGAKSRTDRFSKDLRDIRKISRVSKFSTSLHFLVISHQCWCGRSWMVWSLSCQFSVGFSKIFKVTISKHTTCLYMFIHVYACFKMSQAFCENATVFKRDPLLDGGMPALMAAERRSNQCHQRWRGGT